MHTKYFRSFPELEPSEKKTQTYILMAFGLEAHLFFFKKISAAAAATTTTTIVTTTYRN